MDNNKICNPKVEMPTGFDLNDKDYISCLNSCLKEMSKNYVTAMTEASNEKLFQIYKGIFNEVIALQKEVYQLMFRKGWYVLEAEQTEKIMEKFNTLNQEYTGLNS